MRFFGFFAFFRFQPLFFGFRRIFFFAPPRTARVKPPSPAKLFQPPPPCSRRPRLCSSRFCSKILRCAKVAESIVGGCSAVGMSSACNLETQVRTLVPSESRLTANLTDQSSSNGAPALPPCSTQDGAPLRLQPAALQSLQAAPALAAQELAVGPSPRGLVH